MTSSTPSTPSTPGGSPRNLLTVKALAFLAMAAMVMGACTSQKQDKPVPGASGRTNPDPAPAGTSPTAAGGEETRPDGGSRSRRPEVGAPGGPERTRCGKITGGKAGVMAHLVDVRLGSHAGYDRMTFVFEPASVPTPDGGRTPVQSGTPRYEIGPATPPFTEDPSDRPMSVRGAAFSRITLHGVSGVDLSGSTARQTYRGPRHFKPGFKVLREAQQESDFEATMSWVLGQSRPRCPRVLELSNPPRLAVQFPH